MSKVSRLKDLLSKTLNKAGIQRQIGATLICQFFRRAISKINKKAAMHCRPLYFRNKTLYVKCDSAVWAQELQMLNHLIIEEINQKIKKEVVERIQIKI